LVSEFREVRSGSDLQRLGLLAVALAAEGFLAMIVGELPRMNGTEQPCRFSQGGVL